MHALVERFVGRYQVWRDERTRYNNPLNLFAVLVAISVAQVAYTAIFKHQLSWRIALVAATDIAFLVLYFRRSRFAWLASPFWGTLILIQLLFAHSLSSHYPPRIVLITICFGILIGAGLIAWGFAIRRRYYSYIGYQS